MSDQIKVVKGWEYVAKVDYLSLDGDIKAGQICMVLSVSPGVNGVSWVYFEKETPVPLGVFLSCFADNE